MTRVPESTAASAPTLASGVSAPPPWPPSHAAGNPDQPAVSAVLAPMIAMGLLACLLATAGTLFIHRQYLAPHFAPRLATVDVVRLVDEHQAAMLRELESLSADELARRRPQATQRSQTFARALEEALARLGQQCRCVIVSRAAVLGGTALTDHTDRLRAELAAAGAVAPIPPGSPLSPPWPAGSR